MQSKPVSFGKRGVAQAQTSAAAGSRPAASNALDLLSTGVPIAELAKSLQLTGTASSAASPAGSRDTGVVPRSWRAGILAGFAVSCAKAGFVILNARNQSPEVAGLMQMAGVDQTRALPLLLAGSLLSGAEAAAGTILFAHSMLRRMNNSSVVGYGLGGGLVAVVATGISVALGSADVNWPVEIATGVAVGVLYRLFAGARG